jgi:pyridoxal phosphate enzyme (YggS family)
MDPDSALRALSRNLDELRERIEGARHRTPHASDVVSMVVVTKAAPEGVLRLLPACGVRAVGENRVQSALAKRPAAPKTLSWHGIGHLQRNKAAKATTVFDVFHALDGFRLAQDLEAILARDARTWPVHVEVNAARDPAKGGVPPEEALSFWRQVNDLPHLRVEGFMTMAAEGAPVADLRATFRTLREVRDDAVRSGVGRVPPRALSMGMSDDFEVAVEEGATCVRLGRSVWRGIDAVVAPTTATGSD